MPDVFSRRRLAPVVSSMSHLRPASAYPGQYQLATSYHQVALCIPHTQKHMRGSLCTCGLRSGLHGACACLQSRASTPDEPVSNDLHICTTHLCAALQLLRTPPSSLPKARCPPGSMAARAPQRRSRTALSRKKRTVVAHPAETRRGILPRLGIAIQSRLRLTGVDDVAFTLSRREVHLSCSVDRIGIQVIRR
ncbi:hypothetical protein C8R44DRAFT_779192 [Mycena epipterygia]|nr:hypothetical protein C8R44DRAFT_779192 [Mycena epipterygia]